MVLRKIHNFLNRSGNRRKCYICGATFFKFLPYRKGNKGRSPFIQQLQMVGSDLDNFKCPACGAHDRERHLFMYFDALNLWSEMNASTVLHFAPEKHLSQKIQNLRPKLYIMADLYPNHPDIQKIDATQIPYPDATFHVVIANHILEHIPEYHLALQEFFRVLHPGGFAILQTPYSRLLHNIFEDPGIHTPEQRYFFYGQENHTRVFGEKAFFNSLQAYHFQLEIHHHHQVLQDKNAQFYGVPAHEPLILARKPPN